MTFWDRLWNGMKAEIASWPRGFDPDSDKKPEEGDYSAFGGDAVANAARRAFASGEPSAAPDYALDERRHAIARLIVAHLDLGGSASTQTELYQRALSAADAIEARASLAASLTTTRD